MLSRSLSTLRSPSCTDRTISDGNPLAASEKWQSGGTENACRREEERKRDERKGEEERRREKEVERRGEKERG